MKRLLSVLTALALIVSLAAVAAARDDKDKDKAPPAKDKADKDKADKGKAELDKAGKDISAVKSAAAAGDYYPLKVGNTWFYKVGENHFSVKVTKFEKVGDINCARLEMFVEDKFQAVEHIAVTPEGVERVAFDNKKSEPPLVFLKVPVKKGEEWKVSCVVGKVDTSPGDKVSATFKEGEAKIKVPAGEYDTVSVSSTDLDANGTKLKFTYYFAKDVGMVKQEIVMQSETVTVELLRFDPAK
jgi:hypothetical protein